MTFIIYDVIFLVLFVILISVFLYTRKKNLKKEGLLFLYKTKWGIKLINRIGKKYKKTLKIANYISIGLGYILMILAIYLIGKIIWIYLAFPNVVRMIKVPPIMPLIPYIDKLVPGLPSFYFTYWIVILAIVAIVHEFAHGIFAVYHKVNIKKTGFGFFPFFLPIFLAAFVEPNEKLMQKRSKFSQMSILSAGTFFNVITAILFFGVIALFFSAAFTPSGVVFNDYAYNLIEVSSITMINNQLVNPANLEDVSKLMGNASFNNITANGMGYVGVKGVADEKKIALYYDSPAIRVGLNGAITEINGVKITSQEGLSTELEKYQPGEGITIKTTTGNDIMEYNIVLKEHPEQAGKPWLGIGFLDQSRSGIMGKIIDALSSFKKNDTYYISGLGEFGWFIYNLLWWLILISISVALINMLPVGIFDGGRFFYLTIWAITKKEKIARRTFSIITYLFLAVVAVLMIFWIKSFFK